MGCGRVGGCEGAGVMGKGGGSGQLGVVGVGMGSQVREWAQGARGWMWAWA
jgi:hypothetical protein